MYKFNITYDICGFIIMLILFCGMLYGTKKKSIRNRLFFTIVIVQLLYFIIEFIACGFYFIYSESSILHFLNFILTPMMIALFSLVNYFLISYLKGKGTASWELAHASGCFSSAVIVLSFICYANGALFEIREGAFIPGYFFYVLYVISYLNLVYFGVLCLVYRKTLGFRNTIALLSYTIIPIIAGLVDVAFETNFLPFSQAVCAMICFTIVQHDEIVNKNNELNIANVNLNSQVEKMKALANIYHTLHVINLYEDTLYEYSVSEEVKEYINGRENAAEVMKNVMSHVTASEFLDEILEFTDLTTIAERMVSRDFISKDFIGLNVGWCRGSFIVIDRDEYLRPINIIWATQVIEKEKRKEEGLIKISRTDELTGVYNRRAYEEALLECDILGADGLNVVAIDINGLKVVNDSLGHAAGDELIVGASMCVKKSLGAYGKIFRTGGDEFSVIFYANKNQLEKIKQDIKEAESAWKGELVSELSFSCGFVSKDEMPNASINELFVEADVRMNKAKGEYYSRLGIDRRGQRDAHTALCALYTKILKINITNDSYIIINMDEAEQTEDKGFADKISSWLTGFANSGQVHPDDVDYYLKQTNIDNLKEYFKNGNDSVLFFYRRMIGSEYKRVMMEIIPANDYSDSSQNLYLYVKNIDRDK